MHNKIKVAIPYCLEKDYGSECNLHFSRLQDDEFGCILDHDCMPTTYNWYKHLDELTDKYPQDYIGAVCNRMGHKAQCLAPRCPSGDNIVEHRAYGERVENNHWGKIIDITDYKTPGGILICCSRNTWSEAGGFDDGLIGVDGRFATAVKKTGRRILLARGLYLYHWYRGGDNGTPKHLLKGPTWLLDGNETFTSLGPVTSQI
jgi:hypothetical protein